ncbi:Panacea domain-containing protein [Thomasclavelia spiroformis]|uniref:Panacea domain-containing protein n=1 Tax=Thomasclavelia spiroformis TaxID=29348 RepID=UPI003209169C
MKGKERKDFCITCRKDTEYILKKQKVIRVIKDKEYQFFITTAICTECGLEMAIPGLIDKNIKEVDEQYRAIEEIVTIEDIERLMKIYKIGKAPLSLALGFGEVTISRYLAGQIPSKNYSDIIRKALTSPTYMKRMLNKNKEKIADAAYSKAITAAEQLENLFSISDKMLRVIYYVFQQLEEVTPLMLQKLLYFIQGIYLALYNISIFEEDCEAWIHGPVYPEVYNLFKDFKYNPIDDARFFILDGARGKLTIEERKVINLVVNTFGLYGGKTLERITHNESPWRLARKGYDDSIPSNEIITKDSIKEYFSSINQKYPLNREEGIKQYINAMFQASL